VWGLGAKPLNAQITHRSTGPKSSRSAALRNAKTRKHVLLPFFGGGFFPSSFFFLLAVVSFLLLWLFAFAGRPAN
jgi:hypothetical protein